MMRRRIMLWNLLGIGISVLMLAACNSTDVRQASGKAAANAYSTGDYKIGSEDVLDVIVWKSPDLSKVVSVRPDGKISLPLIGDIVVEGLTVAQVKQDLEARLKEFKESPNVSVVVQQVNSYGIYVLGEVAKPGRYQMKTFTTVLQAISTAGGFTPFAAKNRMFVLRKSSNAGAETRIDVSYDDIISGGGNVSQNILLIPGDTVVVP
jgi:polysaccharide export outer membrane protein